MDSRNPIEAEMDRQAEGCAAGANDFWDANLNFSDASLQRLDDVISNFFGEADDPETVEGAIQAFGAYVGECVRLIIGGSWRDEGRPGQPILVEVGPKKKRVDPFQAVRHRFANRDDATYLFDWFYTIEK